LAPACVLCLWWSVQKKIPILLFVLPCMVCSLLCFHPRLLPDVCIVLVMLCSSCCCSAVERHKVGILVGHDAKMVRREPRTSDRLMDTLPEALVRAHGLTHGSEADIQPLNAGGGYGGKIDPEPNGEARNSQHGQDFPFGQVDPYAAPVGSYPVPSEPLAGDGPMHDVQFPHTQGNNLLGPLNEVEARQEVQKLDRVIAEAEFRAGLPDTTHTTPPSVPGEDIIEKEERTGMYFACLIVIVLGALAAGYSLHKFQAQKAGIDAVQESGYPRAQEDDQRVPEGIATKS